MKLEPCEGCKADCASRYITSYAQTKRGIPFKEFVKKCPCSKCIVKVICEDICQKFYLYVTGGKRLHNTLISRFIDQDGWTHMYSWDYAGKQPGLCGRSFKK
jgi:hypothetical protein